MFIVLVLDLLWCLVIQGSVQSLRVPPRDPLERGQFQLAQSTERLAAPDEPGLVRAVDALGHGVVVRVADRAGGREHPVLRNARGAHRADVPRTVIAVAHESLVFRQIEVDVSGW